MTKYEQDKRLIYIKKKKNNKYDRYNFREKHIDEYIKLFYPDLKKDLKECNVIEIGFGGVHNLSIYLAPYVKSVKAIDLNPNKIKQARDYANKRKVKNVSYFVKSAYDLNKKEKFDIVLLSDVIEHVRMQKKLLEICIDILKEDGIIYLNTPNKWFPVEAHTGHLFIGYFPPKLADKLSTLIYKKHFRNIFLIGYFRLLILLNELPIDYHFKSFSNPNRLMYKMGKPFVDTSSFFWFFSNAFQLIIKKTQKYS